MRVIAIIIATTMIMAGQCSVPMNVRESCEVLRKTAYRDGKFTFTDAEIDALREVNQNKIIAIKNYYRDNCPTKG